MPRDWRDINIYHKEDKRSAQGGGSGRKKGKKKAAGGFPAQAIGKRSKPLWNDRVI